MSKLSTFAAGAGLGAATAYFLDGDSGARRRNLVRDKAGKYARRGGGAAQAAAAQAQGMAARAQHAATGGDSAPGDDNTLKRKVETELFRAPDAPKGSVDVLVVDAIVELRGQVDDAAQGAALESAARKVTGVRDVRNMLHLPGEPAPNIVNTPGAT